MGRCVVLQSFAHLLIEALEIVLSGAVDISGAAQVVLQVVNAPGSIGFGILHFVAETAFIHGAGLWSGRRVDTNLQSLGMHVIREGLHVGKLPVGDDISFRVPFILPGVINIDIDVSQLAHAGGHHGIGHGADRGVIDFAREFVPAVPTHGRSSYQAVVRQVVQRR